MVPYPGHKEIVMYPPVKRFFGSPASSLALLLSILLVGCSDDQSPLRLSPSDPHEIRVIRGQDQAGEVGTTLGDSLGILVVDANGNRLRGQGVIWTVELGSGSVSSQETVTDQEGQSFVALTLGKAAGPHQVRARVGGLEGALLNALALAGPPAQVSKAGGDQQIGQAGTAAPEALRVLLEDAHGNPVQGAAVFFRIIAGSGSLTQQSSITNVNGIAETFWILGTDAGEGRVEAGVGDLPTVVFSSATTPASPATVSKVAGDSQQGAVGESLPEALVVRVADRFGNPTPGTQVHWSVSKGQAAFAGVADVTDAAGLSSAQVTLGSVAGVLEVVARVDGTQGAAFSVTGRPGVVTELQVAAGDHQIAKAGKSFGEKLVVKALDRFGNPVPDVSLAWIVGLGGGSLSPDLTTSGPDGTAETIWTAGTSVGVYEIGVRPPEVATSGQPGLSAAFRGTVVADDPAELRIVSGNAQPGSIGRPLRENLVAQVLDQYGNAVVGEEVTWSLSPGGGMLASTLTTSDQQGFSLNEWTLGPSPGEQWVQVAVTGVNPVLFNATAVEELIKREVVVVDPGSMDLLSDSTQAASGTYRFRVADGAPQVAAGDVLVGTEWGGYLRRVTSVQKQGDVLTATTEQAALGDVVEDGEFATVISPFSPSPPYGAPSGVTWGETEVIYAAPGVSIGGAEVNLNGFIIYDDGSLSLRIEKGEIKLTPDLNLGVTFKSGKVSDFHAIVGGDLTAELLLRAEAAVELKSDPIRKTVYTHRTTFVTAIGWVPVVGAVELSMDVVADWDINFDGFIQGGFDFSQRVEYGAIYDRTYPENDRWRQHKVNVSGFREKPIETGAVAEAKVTVRLQPKAAVILYAVAGPALAIDPYLRVRGTADVDACSWDLDLYAGLRAILSMDIKVLEKDPDQGNPWELTFDIIGETPVARAFGRDLCPGSFDELRIQPGTAEIGTNQNQILSAVAFKGGNAIQWPGGGTVQWRAEPDGLVSLTPEGENRVKVEPRGGEGTASIFATFGGITSSSPATVRIIPVGAAASAAVVKVGLLDITPSVATLALDLVIYDENGNLVTDWLQPDALSIDDRNVNGGTLTFTPIAQGIGDPLPRGSFSAALVVDQSGSMRSYDPQGARKTAVKQFTREMTSGDEAALFTFANTVRRVTGFESSATGLDAAVDALPGPDGTTALYDAAATACEFVGAQGRNSNRVVVLLTDGEENASRTTLGGAIDACSSRGVRILTVGFASSRLEQLARLSGETGGVAFYDADVGVLLSAFRGAAKIARGEPQPRRVLFAVNSSNSGLLGGGSFFSALRVQFSGRSVVSPFLVKWEGSSGGGPIVYGSNSAGTLGLGASQEWTFSAESGEGVLVVALPSSSGLDLAANLSPIDGGVVGGNHNTFDNDGEWVPAVVSSSGTKTIRISAAAGSGAYALRLDRCRVFPVAIGGPKTTTSLTRSDCTYVPDPQNPLYGAYFTFAGQQGQSVTVQLDSPWRGALILFGQSGAMVAAVESDISGATLTATLPQTGSYILYPTSREPGQVGEIGITITAGASPSPGLAPSAGDDWLENNPGSVWLRMLRRGSGGS
jgi:hypothetical protein